MGPVYQYGFKTVKMQLTVVAESSVSVKVTTRVDGVELVVCTENI